MSPQSEPPPPVVVPEVLPPEPAPGPDSASGGPRAGRVAFHAWSALALVVVDNLWNLPEFAAPALLAFTVPMAFATVFLSVFIAQRRRNQDARGSAFWKAVFLGVLAAIPTSITGTPVGLAMLAWAGIQHPWRK
jgi:lipid-A-disaccharide synthase-like uncharacterized protein